MYTLYEPHSALQAERASRNELARVAAQHRLAAAVKRSR